MLIKLAIMLPLEFVIFAVLLFGGAGTLHWPAVWAFLGLFFTCTIALVVDLAVHDPKLLEERMKSAWQADQPRWDKVFLTVVLVAWCGWFVLMGMDAVRYGWTHVPALLQWVGAAGIIVSNWIVHLVFRENTFAAPVVKIQYDRGQKVISTGPYAIVRHPMYAGASLYFPCIPLMLGSGWGVAVGLLIIAAVSWRIIGEERELELHLEGYTDYKRRVPYRLVPGIW